MKKRGFTIVELVIAITIFSLIVVYMYQAVAATKKGNTIYEKNYEAVERNEDVKKVFYNDIFNQVDPYKDIEFKKGIFYLKTKNSLHNFIAPHVAYMLKDKTLIRVESPRQFKLPLQIEDMEKITHEVTYLLENIDNFHVFMDKNNYTIYWTQKKKKTIFQIKLPYYRKVIIIESEDKNSSK